MKRRNFTAKFKTKVILEAIKEQKTLAQIAQHHTLAPTQISKWKKSFYRVRKTYFTKALQSEKNELETECDMLLKTIG